MANGVPIDLSELDIDIRESGKTAEVTVSNLPAFEEDGITPIAYSAVPADSSGKISGTVYGGYEIRFPSVPKPDNHFYRFPDNLAELPQTGFSTRYPQVLSAKPLSLNYDHTGLTLEIPSLDVMTDIVVVPFTENEYPIRWLGSFAGMLEGSALPGEGVSIITGHNHLSTTEAGPFALLSRLTPGAKLFVLNQDNQITSFTVVDNELIDAADITGLETIVSVYGNTLALVTCENEQPEGGYANRRVITAIPD